MDKTNRLLNHIVVAILSASFVYLLTFTGMNLNRSVAAVSFILLFLTLIIGPSMKLFQPQLKELPLNLPWSWRGELGIWFVILSIVHGGMVFYQRQGFGTLRIGDYLAFVALFLGILLAITSFEKIINYIGIRNWKWLHSFAYVIFYTGGFHTINHAFLRTGRPDHWMHWAYLVMIVIVIVLQFSAFAKNIAMYRKEQKAASSN